MRFWFDVRYDDDAWSEDDEGTELRDPEEARRSALDLALSLAKADAPIHELTVRVRDGEPAPVLLVRLLTEVETRPRMRV